jgi:hypothetical protein
VSNIDGELTDEAGLSEHGKELLHGLMDTAIAFDGNWPGLAAWNAAVHREYGETTQAFIRRMKAARK